MNSLGIETIQAMQTMKLAMSYETSVTKMCLDTQESVAEMIINQMLPATNINVFTDRIIDVYA